MTRLEAILEQMQQLKKMGSIKSLLQMMPGMPKELKDMDIDEGQFDRIQDRKSVV